MIVDKDTLKLTYVFSIIPYVIIIILNISETPDIPLLIDINYVLNHIFVFFSYLTLGIGFLIGGLFYLSLLLSSPLLLLGSMVFFLTDLVTIPVLFVKAFKVHEYKNLINSVFALSIYSLGIYCLYYYLDAVKFSINGHNLLAIDTWINYIIVLAVFAVLMILVIIGEALTPTQEYYIRTSTTSKYCGSCHKNVSSSFGAGDRCPYCGVYWSIEKHIS